MNNATDDRFVTGSRAGSRSHSALLWLGIAAAPLYIVAGALQIVMRDGFDMRRHPLSLLSNGDLGWIQVANFIASGVLVLAGALGCRLALRGRSAGTWGPVLLGAYGLGLIGCGIFPPDPAQGFPPGSEVTGELSSHGLLHFVLGGLGFAALIAACFVFARRFARQGERGLAWYSSATGFAFLAAFAGIASGTVSALIMVAFYVAVAWIWIWYAVVLRHTRRLGLL